MNEKKPIQGFIIEEDNQIIGYTMIVRSYSTEYGGICIWVEDLYLLPAYRGKGLGSIILEFIENTFQKEAVRFRLEVAKSNKKAIEAYHKNGYKQLDYIQMTKEETH